MTDTLTQLNGKVQNILGDSSGALFTTAICTAAVRQALLNFNIAAPRNLDLQIQGINLTLEYEVTDADPLALKVTDVLLKDLINNEQHISIDFDQYNEDERIWIRLRNFITSSQYLIVRYIRWHTINGLDSETESTIPANFDQVLVDGAAYYALLTRAVSRVEANNLDSNYASTYKEITGHFQRAFNLGLATARNKPTPVSEPDTRSWNDPYFNWLT